MEIEISNEKKVQINKIKYIVMLEQEELKTVKEKAIFLLQKGTDLTDEEVNDLEMNDGIKLQLAINKNNSVEDFQKPVEE